MSGTKQLCAIILLLIISFFGPSQAQSADLSATADKSAVVVASSTAGATAQGPPPNAYLPEQEHHFGSVDPGITVSYDFIVENHGPGDLVIEKVAPG